MSKSKITVRPIVERRFALIPIDKIVVLNSRQRDEERFKETVRSISELGLYKPICVNERQYKKTGTYELVCGEGRLEACRQLGKTFIEAEVIDVHEEQALLAGLAENLTRAKKDVVDFMRRIFQMYERGVSLAELARITGKVEQTIRDYIALMRKGEERLIRGVEEGIFSINFAIQVIECPESSVQNLLMDEFLNGNITSRDLGCITKILKEREEKGQTNKDMTFPKLRSAIKERVKDHKLYCARGKVKRNDAIYLMESLETLWKDEKFCEMIKELSRPEIKGQYGN